MSLSPVPVVSRSRSWLGVVAVAWMAVTIAPTPVAAQRGQAFVRVNATVVDFTQADVIGVHRVAPRASTRQAAGVMPDGDAWRITAGGSPAVGVRLEATGGDATGVTPAASLCEVPAAATACRAGQVPATRTPAVVVSPESLLRVGRSPEFRDGDGEVERSVRLTIDYIGI